MKGIKTGILLFIALTLLTGVLYPVAVTVLAQTIFPKQSSGSIIYSSNGTPSGSALIGQPFSDPKNFWSRPSATADFPYNPIASGGSNLGPTNKDLIARVEDRAGLLRGTGIQISVPADMVMASGSGLDPYISFESALLQVPRIAKERRMSEDKVHSLMKENFEGRQFGFLGAPRVNVCVVNK